MINALSNCDSPNAAAVAAAIKDCPIIGKFPSGGGPTGMVNPSSNDSLTWHPGYGRPTSVILGNNFFTKPPCEQYVTLCRECYLRVVLGNYDDTGGSDKPLADIFKPLEKCLGCVGKQPWDPAQRTPCHSHGNGPLPPNWVPPK